MRLQDCGGELMSKQGLIAFILAVIVLLSLSPRSTRPVFGQAASMEAPHFGEGGLPQFERDPNFPKEGKFVMAIGTSGQTGSNATQVLKGATRLHVYPKTNELFVSDGYGNSRIMVYDADTGQFKRMWGAFGNKPLDIDARPPRSEPAGNPWVAVSEVLQQYGSPVHDVNISNDGSVYVADRVNKRVQAFMPDGKFIA